MDLLKELRREMAKAEDRVKSIAAAIATLAGDNSHTHRYARRKMSTAARNRISLGQKARWKARKEKAKQQ
jgi:hypothetical protein